MVKQFGLVAVALVVLIALFVAVETSFSDRFAQCKGAQSEQYKQGTAEKNETTLGRTIYIYVRCTGDFIEANEGSIAALAALIIAAFTATLWYATSAQAAITRESLVANKRAFVFASAFTQFYELDPVNGRHNWRFRPHWRNSGDTPTKRLIIHTNCELRNTQLPHDFNFDYATTNTGQGFLGPKFEQLGGIAPMPPDAPITPQDILDVQAGRKYLYLMGWAKYYDVFPNTPPRITRFCWQILPFGDPAAFVPNDPAHTLTFSHVFSPRGNCADEECNS